jgi:hypothetical protein
VYNCCCSLPVQSFSGPSPAGFMTTFYCLRLETSPTWRTRSSYLYPPGTERPGYYPRHWVPFSSPPTTLRATVELFDPAPPPQLPSLQHLCTNRVENIVSNSTSIATCISVAAKTFLPSRCLETALVYSLISQSFHSNSSTRYSMIQK